MCRYLIIADDLTGANDTGVQIRRRGIPVRVVFSSDLIGDGSTVVDSVVLDTETRALSPALVTETIHRELGNVDFTPFTVIRKVDSTLRGSIGAEIKAVDDCYKSDLVIFAPALPDLGRTTVDGIHKLNGVPITKTELARDPKTPVTEDNIQKILQGGYSEEVVLVKLADVQAGTIPLGKARIYAFDAVTNTDMQTIIKAAIKTKKKRILWVGTAAMADNLLSIGQTVPPALAVVSSLSTVSREQIHYAEKQGVAVVQVPIRGFIAKTAVADTFADEAIGVLKSGKDVMVVSASSYDKGEVERTAQVAEKLGMSSEAVGAYMQEVLSKITLQILEKVKVSGIFLAGGDTAMGFFKAAGSAGSEIVTEIAIGIPLMRLSGGPFAGMKVVTKAGAFGKEDAILFALRKLKEI